MNKDTFVEGVLDNKSEFLNRKIAITKITVLRKQESTSGELNLEAYRGYKYVIFNIK